MMLHLLQVNYTEDTYKVLEQVKEEPVALTIFFIVIGILAILGIVAWKTLPKWVENKHKLEYEQLKIEAEEIKTNADKETIKIEEIDKKIAHAEEVEYEYERQTAETVSRVTKLENCSENINETLTQIQAAMAEDRKERLQRQIELDNALNNFRTEINTVKENISVFGIEIDEMKNLIAEKETYMESISQGALVQMLNDEVMKPKHRARALLRLFALGVNGRTRQNGIKFVFEKEEHKEAWLDAVEDLKYLNLKIKDEAYFRAAIEEINEKLIELRLLPSETGII